MTVPPSETPVETGAPPAAPPAATTDTAPATAEPGVLGSLVRDPNPVWMRELKQAARLSRTPVILAVMTSMMALLMASVGGIASVEAEPAKVGVALYHTFFSLAFAVVAWVAPAVAANAVASERGGRTWEALVLTGLGAASIARGKFLAAFSYIMLYVVMLAPVGALCFLFGGVTASEVLLAFVLLFVFAALSTAFGLSISSSFSSPAVAVVVTLLVAVPLSMIVYVLGGVVLSIGVHDLWSAVPAGPPIWLPTAYVRAEFGIDYVALLITTPLVLALVPAWFLYEVTVANMRAPSDDRSSGLRRWFVVACPLIATVTLAPAMVATGPEWWALSISALVCFLTFCALLFAGEPLGPSLRVELAWTNAGAGAPTRLLGPGVVKACGLLLGFGVAALAVQTVLGFRVEPARSPLLSNTGEQVLVFGGYATAFFVFLCGLAVWARARSKSGSGPRMLLVSMIFLALVGPWMVMAIAGVLTQGRDEALILAAPSPTYAGVMMKALATGSTNSRLVLSAGGLCAAGWALLGLGLFAVGTLRTRRLLEQWRSELSRLQAQRTEAAEPAAESAEPAAEPAEPHAEPAAAPPEAPAEKRDG